MREIKFRAFDKDTKQMITDFSVRSDGYVEVLEGDGRSGVFMRQDFVLMQYTGLKDKNGVEIYEGDVLRYLAPEEFGDERQETYVVEWVGYGFKARWQQALPSWNQYPENSLAGTDRDMEIIGNIYENPELLEANQ